MNDIGARQLAYELGPVDELRDHSSQVLHPRGPAQRPRWNRIDGHEPRVDVGIAAPRPQQPVGLDSLTTKNAERRSDDSDAKPAGARHDDHCPGRLETERDVTMWDGVC